ncbi:hypothetical protein [Treponema sp.]|uniref:hypothetical protein n=1 Tax=Treponema sp. TaxID=166 RepID=UPI003FD8FA44
MNEEDQCIFNNALKTATAEMSSDGKLVYYDIESAIQDAEKNQFSMSLSGLVKFYFVVKRELEK